eukprot:1784215-Rhodomonas_salina.1
MTAHLHAVTMQYSSWLQQEVIAEKNKAQGEEERTVATPLQRQHAVGSRARKRDRLAPSRERH